MNLITMQVTVKFPSKRVFLVNGVLDNGQLNVLATHLNGGALTDIGAKVEGNQAVQFVANVVQYLLSGGEKPAETDKQNILPIGN